MHEEPFRLFFPIAVLAGLLGVLLWPVMIAGWMTDYPGLRHARLMTHGFFGGFILGFMGTSMPKLLEVKQLSVFEAVLPLLLHFSSVVAHACGATLPGDALFAAALVWMVAALVRRFPDRKDLPPPGFVLLGLGFICGLAGMVMQQTASTRE
ncbi:MAG TPA: NnrS family protein, partial [Roseimicrobium sp.]|nr:NnrS family protein [Roseimicrobium sp.]